MSTEQRFRMTVDCPCLGCKLAAVINAEKPQGFTCDDIRDLLIVVSTIAAATLTVGEIAGSLTIGAMTPEAARKVIEPWRAVQ